MDLASLGWNDHFRRAFAPFAADGCIPARVALEHKHAYLLFWEQGETAAEIRGRMLLQACRSQLPAVGDWVAIDAPPADGRASIQAVLPRRTCFSRRAAGNREEEQVVAANVDTVFLVNGLDADLNLRRIERYLAIARGSGAAVVVLLNKADVCPEAYQRLDDVRRVAADVPVHVVSAERGDGLDALPRYLVPGCTIALLGSSGVGKSTLANRLIGLNRQAVGPLREADGRGRHTTARRELIPLPSGALLIDTPGMRELQLWGSAREGLLAVFPEVMEMAANCRFRDCRHEAEPGCAVLAALEAGALARKRFASFQKLRGELESLGSGSRSSSPAEPRPRVTGRRIMRG